MGSDQDRRVLLAIVLSLAVYLVWTQWFAPPPPTPAAESVEPALATGEPTAPVSTPAPAAPVSAPTATVATHSEIISGEGWSAQVHSANGALRSLDLTGYSSAVVVTPIWTWVSGKVTGKIEGGWDPYTGGEEKLHVLTEGGAMVLAGGGELDDDGAGTLGEPSVYRVERQGDAVIAARTRPDGLRITKTYRPGQVPYTTAVEVRFDNTGSEAIEQLWVGVADDIAGEGQSLMDRAANVQHPQAYVDGFESVLDTSELGSPEEVELFSGPVSWFGLGDRYFLAALAPLEGSGPTGQVRIDALPGGRVGSFMVDAQALDAGASRTLTFTAYSGPKDLELLKSLGHDLDQAVEYGWFGFFSKILLFLLQIFHAGVSNWGLSIILLTLAVKLAFFPLTQKAFKSSRRMQALQPLLSELKEKYKDNKELQTQETMKLFQEHKVNPMGGCLPTLIQLPVWIALYNVMYYSVELYDTAFLYLADLTAADPYGVIPTAYAGLMLLQQRMMPTASLDETQQKVIKMMPLVFAFIMYSFPSGLVMYFCVNMLLTIFQQWVIKRQVPDVPATA